MSVKNGNRVFYFIKAHYVVPASTISTAENPNGTPAQVKEFNQVIDMHPVEYAITNAVRLPGLTVDFAMQITRDLYNRVVELNQQARALIESSQNGGQAPTDDL